MPKLILAFPESEGYGIPPESYIGPFATEDEASAWIDQHGEGLPRKYVLVVQDLEAPGEYIAELLETLRKIDEKWRQGERG